MPMQWVCRLDAPRAAAMEKVRQHHSQHPPRDFAQKQQETLDAVKADFDPTSMSGLRGT